MVRVPVFRRHRRRHPERGLEIPRSREHGRCLWNWPCDEYVVSAYWVQDDLISAGETEVEYPSLQMVDPDDRMEMLWHHVVPVTGELNWCFLREGAALVC